RSGNLTQVEDNLRGVTQYHYDPLDRLTQVRGNISESFAHDPAGNLIQDRLSNVSGNQLLFQGDCHYQYDEFGNLIQEARGTQQSLVTTYAYDCQHRLIRVEKPDGSSAEYRYDAFGRRIHKAVTDKTGQTRQTEFLWQGDKLLAESGEHHYQTYLYEYGSFKPLALVTGEGADNATPYFYHLDQIGTPLEITDATGAVAWSVDYHSYGNVAYQRKAEIVSPLRFQGQYYDAETGLHYNRHRYYSPGTGRFITPDPIGLAGGLNNYQYVKNPTGWVDPLGLTQCVGDCPGGKVPLTQGQIDEIRSIPHGERPDPSKYLSKDYIDSHLSQFNDGASYFVPTDILDSYGRGLLGFPDNTQFVMPTKQLNEVIKESGGDIAKLEKIMGIPEGSWQGRKISVIDIPEPVTLNLRMPSGNEMGANSEWIPGGKLPTGRSEAIVDRIPERKFSERKFE
ncbi:RHS repeat domain-containing protein, partial [Vibrio rhizosphaerae]|uniref:RHS repeat domain-containing protein n=1 Tax=Vibrio rhizosphaerae TaxID=398736 RepID=UPI001B80469F